MYEPEDKAGWAALPVISDEDIPASPSDTIGPLQSSRDAPYTHKLQSHSDRILQLASHPDQGLSFQIWPSAVALSTYAEQQEQHQRGYWKGKRVLELGAGCGLAGLVFAALGATVLLTDLPHVLGLLEQNIALNQAVVQAGGGSVSCCELTWGLTPLTNLGPGWASPDFVVAADIVYHRELFDPLLSTLTALGAKHYILAHIRRWKSDSAFFKQLRKSFLVEDITKTINPDADVLSSHTRGASRLFQLVPKQDQQKLDQVT